MFSDRWLFQVCWNGTGGDSGDGGDSGGGSSGGGGGTDGVGAATGSNTSGPGGTATAVGWGGGAGQATGVGQGMGGPGSSGEAASVGGSTSVGWGGGQGGTSAADTSGGGSPGGQGAAAGFGGVGGVGPGGGSASPGAAFGGTDMFNTTTVNKSPPDPGKSTNQLGPGIGDPGGMMDPGVRDALNALLGKIGTPTPSLTDLANSLSLMGKPSPGVTMGFPAVEGVSPGLTAAPAGPSPAPVGPSLAGLATALANFGQKGIGSDAVAGGTAPSPSSPFGGMPSPADFGPPSTPMAPAVTGVPMMGPMGPFGSPGFTNTTNLGPSQTPYGDPAMYGPPSQPGFTNTTNLGPQTPYGNPSFGPPSVSQTFGGMPGRSTFGPSSVAQAIATQSPENAAISVAQSLQNLSPAEQSQVVGFAIAQAQQTMSATDYQTFLTKMLDQFDTSPAPPGSFGAVPGPPPGVVNPANINSPYAGGV